MNVISHTNLFRYFSDGWWFGDTLRDFFHEHGARIEANLSNGPWFWSDQGASERCLDAAWDMLGKWQARRGVLVDRARFVSVVPRPIQTLAYTLNEHGVDSLGTLVARSSADRETVVRAIFRTVEVISRVKPTQTLTPMFGSKVVHHYFPSVVPVFDDAKIRKHLMCSDVWRRSTGDAARQWRRHVDRAGSSDAAMRDFQQYFAFCAAQIEDAPLDSLRGAREALGTRCVPFAPPSLHGSADSLIWKLDAKIAEFCGCGAAV